MQNVDKYKKQLISAESEDRACAAARLRGVFCKHEGTDVYDCKDCMQESFAWLFSEHEPPLLKNGDGLKPGDKIMVRVGEGAKWEKALFLCYVDGFFVCASFGDKIYFGGQYTSWRQARLPEEGE